MLGYLKNLSMPRFILWCYLIWWLSVASLYFDPSPRLWLNSAGISAIIGFALYLSTAYAGPQRQRIGNWALARLFMMPFCVSSFAALIKGRGFFLVFPPTLSHNLVPIAGCVFLGLVWQVVRQTGHEGTQGIVLAAKSAPD